MLLATGLAAAAACSGGDGGTGTTPSYSLSLSPPALEVVPGGNGNTTVTMTRANFTGAVALSLGSAPAGITGVFDPTDPTGSNSTLTVTVGAAVAPGVYHLTVDGIGTAGDRSTPMSLTVTGGGGNVTLDFSGCPVSLQPSWLAVQDGSGPWTRVVGVGPVYTFNIASARGGLSYVRVGANSSTVRVDYYAKSEFTSVPIAACTTPAVLKTVNGTVAGIGGTEVALISLGGGLEAVSTLNAGFPNFQITDVAGGSQDLVAVHSPNFNSLADKGIIRRGLNIADNGSIGASLDFTAGEAFALDIATFTITGLAGGETIDHAMSYQVGSCIGAQIYAAVPVTGSTFTAAGVPAARQQATDFHAVSLIAQDAATHMTRGTSQYFHTFGARAVALPAVFPTPTITSLGGTYKRLQAVYTLPADYQQSTDFQYVDHAVSGALVEMTATMAYLGGTAVTLAMPDFSGLAGWNNSWAPSAANLADWWALGTGGNSTAGSCSEGALRNFGLVSGSN
jgi:hypothetical protein